MKALRLVSAIEKLGGKAKIVLIDKKGFDGTPWVSTEVVGTLNGYDVHMYGIESDYYTVRAISKRGTYDAGSDYNTGDWTFCSRIKSLSWACDLEQLPVQAPVMHATWQSLVA